MQTILGVKLQNCNIYRVSKLFLIVFPIHHVILITGLFFYTGRRSGAFSFFLSCTQNTFGIFLFLSFCFLLLALYTDTLLPSFSCCSHNTSRQLLCCSQNTSRHCLQAAS